MSSNEVPTLRGLPLFEQLREGMRYLDNSSRELKEFASAGLSRYSKFTGLKPGDVERIQICKQDIEQLNCRANKLKEQLHKVPINILDVGAMNKLKTKLKSIDQANMERFTSWSSFQYEDLSSDEEEAEPNYGYKQEIIEKPIFTMPKPPTKPEPAFEPNETYTAIKATEVTFIREEPVRNTRQTFEVAGKPPNLYQLLGCNAPSNLGNLKENQSKQSNMQELNKKLEKLNRKLVNKCDDSSDLNLKYKIPLKVNLLHNHQESKYASGAQEWEFTPGMKMTRPRMNLDMNLPKFIDTSPTPEVVEKSTKSRYVPPPIITKTPEHKSRKDIEVRTPEMPKIDLDFLIPSS